MPDKYAGSHEIRQNHEEIWTGSDRSFGIVFACCLAIIAAFSFFAGSERWPWWLAIGALFAVVSCLAPSALAPLNRIWTKFGLLLHLVVSPIILGTLFYVFLTPIGLLMRLSGKDPLRLKFEPDATTYWIRRDPPGPATDTFKNQY